MNTTNPPSRFALESYLGLIQFLFLLTWVVYVIFLGDLLAKLGLSKDFVPKLLLLDQVLFVVADVALGFQADRMLRLFRKIAPLVLVLNLISCLTFIALPHLASTTPNLFIGATLLWVLSASVLRAPLYGLIAQRSAEPGRGTASALLGMGLASAAAPYLGVAFKGIDPLLPFTLAGISLALATLGFSAWEAAQSNPAPGARPHRQRRIGRLAAIAVLLGLGFQTHVFLNSAPLFKHAADPTLLPWLMPVFWIGFSLAVYPGAGLVEKHGAGRVLGGAALTGTLASLACLTSPTLPWLIGIQAIAGAAWGGAFLAGLSLAGAWGHVGREALFVGTIFACLALAAIGRIGLNLIGLPPEASLPMATGFWAAGALLCLPWLARQPAIDSDKETA